MVFINVHMISGEITLILVKMKLYFARKRSCKQDLPQLNLIAHVHKIIAYAQFVQPWYENVIVM